MSGQEPVLDPSPAQIKHLEFLQTVIARQASNSFLLKGWALTVAVAFDAFVAAQLNWRVALIALLPVLTFWFLDAYYLRQERLFRHLFNDAKEPGSGVSLFSFDTQKYCDCSTVKWPNVIFSVTLRLFYGFLLLVGIILFVASAAHTASSHASRTKGNTSSAMLSVQGSAGGQMLPIRSFCQRGTT